MALTEKELRELLTMHLKSMLGSVSSAEGSWLIATLERLLEISKQLEQSE